MANPNIRAAMAHFRKRLDIRLNDYLCEMKPNHDDSIVGFNEAWGIVKKMFEDDESEAKEQ